MSKELLLLLPLLCALVNAEDISLKCDEFERQYESLVGESFCTVSGFSVSHSQNVKIQKYLRANNTKFMKFYDSRLLYLPFKLFDVFSNLKTLDVSMTEILEVPRNTFASASSLSHLNMSNNNITQITTSGFMGASNLVRLDLSRNRIEDLNEFAFKGLSNLDRLHLSHNRIRVLNNDLFLDNEYVEQVHLDNNLIEYFEPEVFSRLRLIRDINLSNNRLQKLHPGTFASAYIVESLVLSSNRLKEFYLENKNIALLLRLDNNNLTKVTVNGTKTLRADNNRITELNLLNSGFMEDLVLSNNNMSDIANITQLVGLLYLDLSYNRIAPLNISTFDQLKRLRELNLRSCGIRELTYGMFSKQTNLETLDLSYNNLTLLNLQVFVPYLSKLRNFYVDGNNLTEIEGRGGFSFAFPMLAKLGISQNRFSCSYLHSILMHPSLSPSVALHIEPIVENVESSHIRDISCSSTVKESLQSAELELSELSKLQQVMKQAMDHMRQHEKRLELYLLLLKIVMVLMVCTLLGVAIMRYWKLRQSSVDYFTRRVVNDSIVFRSSNTINTEH